MYSGVSDLVRKVYEQLGGSVGGNLHIVLDDYNVEDYWIEQCMDRWDGDEYVLTDVEMDCAKALLSVPEDDRIEVIREALGRG